MAGRSRKSGRNRSRVTEEPTVQLGGKKQPVPPEAPPQAPPAPPRQAPIAPTPSAAPRPSRRSVPEDGETILGTAPVGKRAVVAVLVAVAGDLEGQCFPLYPGENRVGRDPSNTIVLDSGRISREHAIITAEDGGEFLIDPVDPSRNVTSLDNEKIEATDVLDDGCLLGLGNQTLLRFRTIDAP